MHLEWVTSPLAGAVPTEDQVYISKASFRNFRNFAACSVEFNPGVNTIIGENAAGKTNLFYGIRLLIDESLPIRSRYLEEDDFNRSLPTWKGHWIVITLFFDGLDLDDEMQAILCHSIKDMKEGSKRGSFSLIFRPNRKIRQQLFDLSVSEEKNHQHLEEVLHTVTIDDYESVMLCRGATDFTDDVVYKKYVGNFETITFPDPADLHEDGIGCPPPRMISFSKEMSCTFIKALRDVMSELRTVRTNPLIRLLRGKSKDIEVEKAADITTRVQDLNAEIGKLKEVVDVSNGIKDTLEAAVGLTYAPTMMIKSELPEDIDSILRSLTLWVDDSIDSEHLGKLSDLSLGGANLIYLSLKLYEYDINKGMEKIGNFLLIEEPEAHIHTHIQKTLFSKIHEERTQVIISTHSTHISAASRISSVNILSRAQNCTRIYQPSRGLSTFQISAIERYLDSLRSTLLFAKGVVLVEGDAEALLIPAMFKSVFGVTLDEVGISLISMNSAFFEHIAVLFDEVRVHRRCAMVTDLDTSILKLPDDPNTDNEIHKKCRNSQEVGKARKDSLLKFCENQKWRKPFFATYTFEVDLLLAGNAWEVERVLEDIYSKPVDIQKSKAKLCSDDISEAGVEILRLARKEGKGWFALRLSEHTNTHTYFPAYILRAVAYAASKSLSPQVMKRMAIYRLEKGCENGDSSLQDYLLSLKDADYAQAPTEFMAAYASALPNDSLSALYAAYKDLKDV